MLGTAGREGRLAAFVGGHCLIGPAPTFVPRRRIVNGGHPVLKRARHPSVSRLHTVDFALTIRDWRGSLGLLRDSVVYARNQLPLDDRVTL